MTDQPDVVQKTARTTNRLLVVLIILVALVICGLCGGAEFALRMINAFLTGYYRGLEEGAAVMWGYI